MGEFTFGDNGVEINSCIYIETRIVLGVPHLVPLHGLSAASVGTGDKDYAVYYWLSDTSPVKVTLLVLVNSYCILPAQDKFTVNKVAAVNLLVRYAEWCRLCILLEPEVTM